MESENIAAIDKRTESTLAELSSAPGMNILGRVSSIAIAFASVALVIWALSSEIFRDHENTLTGKFALPLAVGCGLVLAGASAATRWRNFAAWAGLAILGQAVSLQMIDAGRLIHFQHYRPLRELLTSDPYLVVLFAVQIAFVAIGIAGRLPAIVVWLRNTFGIWRALIVALLLILSGAAVTPDMHVYLPDLAFGAAVQFVMLANIILAVMAVPENLLDGVKEKFDAIFGAKDAAARLDRFALICAVWVVLISASLSYFVYQNHPHVPDEAQYLFQARYMAAGQLTVKAPLVPEAFSMYMVPFQEARWFGIFPPAWPALLAIGTFFNAAWLVNPLLAGLCILLAYLFFQEIYSRRFARISLLLLCCSPWFIFMSMSFMSHVFTLACALAAAVLLLRGIRSQKLIYAFAAGLPIGIASLIRPLDGLILAALLGVWALFRCKTWIARFAASIALALGTICAAAIVLPYNKIVTGNALLLPMDAYYDKYFWPKVMALGFGPERGLGWGLDAFPGHSPLEAIVNAALNIFLLNTELLGWGAGSLLLALSFSLSGKFGRKDIWAAAAIAVVIGSYSLYWYSGGPDFGARYWFLGIIPLIALTVRGIEWLTENLNGSSDPRVLLGVLTLCTICLVTYLPWRSLDKYYHYLDARPGIEELASQHNFGNALVLIQGEEHPDYQSAWIYNPVNFEGNAPIYAWYRDEKTRTDLQKAYSDRRVWLIAGPTRTREGFQIVRGPD